MFELSFSFFFSLTSAWPCLACSCVNGMGTQERHTYILKTIKSNKIKDVNLISDQEIMYDGNFWQTVYYWESEKNINL